MKILNVSNKIIHFKDVAIMPDDELEIKDAESDLPSLKTLEKMGYIKLTGKKAAKAKDKPADKPEAEDATDAAADEKAEAEAPKPRGRKAKDEAKAEE